MTHLLSVVIATVLAGLPQQTLDELIVPEEHLSAECRLWKPSPDAGERGRVRIVPVTGLPITTNPWTGTDSSILSALRQRLDPPPGGLPDGPPPSRRQASAFRQQLAEGVEAGHAAAYETTGGAQITVLALRFTEDGSPFNASRTTRPLVTRLTARRTLVEISGLTGPCRSTSESHVRSVVERQPQEE